MFLIFGFSRIYIFYQYFSRNCSFLCHFKTSKHSLLTFFRFLTTTNAPKDQCLHNRVTLYFNTDPWKVPLTQHVRYFPPLFRATDAIPGPPMFINPTFCAMLRPAGSITPTPFRGLSVHRIVVRERKWRAHIPVGISASYCAPPHTQNCIQLTEGIRGWSVHLITHRPLMSCLL